MREPSLDHKDIAVVAPHPRQLVVPAGILVRARPVHLGYRTGDPLLPPHAFDATLVDLLLARDLDIVALLGRDLLQFRPSRDTEYGKDSLGADILIEEERVGRIWRHDLLARVNRIAPRREAL